MPIVKVSIWMTHVQTLIFSTLASDIPFIFNICRLVVIFTPDTVFIAADLSFMISCTLIPCCCSSSTVSKKGTSSSSLGLGAREGGADLKSQGTRPFIPRSCDDVDIACIGSLEGRSCMRSCPSRMYKTL
ncbi:hypothetical protein BDZ94DRAFT_1266693 [Collybia nuda]|uniref:Uncharacterized protein n=1 Tax=Collybia nuda TaxID=64659 RepID=A0A9P5XYS2_9AGAR|nr:hypothetical protein BDZ94DRAFT_1266693 [Collybia nuda]